MPALASDDEENDPGALAMAVLDADNDGRVSLEEFVAWWRGGCPLEPGESETGMPYDSAAAKKVDAEDQDARTIATQSAFSAGD